MAIQDIPSGQVIEIGRGVALIVTFGTVVGLALAEGVAMKLRAHRIPQAEIDAMARDCLKHFGDRAMRELIVLAICAKKRGAGDTEEVICRIMTVVRKAQGREAGTASENWPG